MEKQPVSYLDHLRLRNHAYGVERRRNMSKMILDYGTPLPKPIEYSDIDEAMFEWVDKQFPLAYDGKRLPTYKLYSTLWINEFLQSWDKLDDTGNLIVNFKTITREVNPQKGENQGNYFNIPGHKDFAMFYVPVLLENGTEAYDKYTMKQPTSVNFIYTVSIVANKMEMVNEMNELMHYEFNAIDAYISPNNHPMSMTLDDVSDESEYAIDDRKYYLQSFKIKVRGYIIRKEDFKVERMPSRLVLTWKDSDATGLVHRRGKNRRKEEKVVFMDGNLKGTNGFRLEAYKDVDECEPIPIPPVEEGRPSEIPEPIEPNTDCCPKEPDRYQHKVMRVVMTFDECDLEMSFNIDKDMILAGVETKNVYDFKILVNEEVMNLDNDIKFLDGDKITVRISRKDDYSSSEVVLIGYDPNEVFDTKNDAETVLDEPYTEEEIIVGK